MNAIQRLNEIERMSMLNELSDEDIKNLPAILDAGIRRFLVAIRPEDFTGFVKGKVTAIGCLREFTPGAIVRYLQTNDDLRMSVVGTAFPCDGGWLVAGNEDTVIVLMVDGPEPETALIKVKIGTDGGWLLGKSDFSIDVAVTDTVGVLHSFVNSYKKGALEDVQSRFNECVEQYQKTSGVGLC